MKKAQEVPKTKYNKTDVTPTTLLYPSLPEYSHSINLLSEFLLLLL